MTLSTRSLRIATLAYLGLPMVLFVVGWTRWPIALGVTATIAWFFVTLVRSGANHADRTVEISWKTMVGLGVVCVLWMSMSGIGGFGYQTYDYEKHNAVLKTLIDSSWPVQLGTEKAPSMLVYYVGYYLVPAAIGKLVGWHATTFVCVIWAGFGVVLVLCWVGVLARAMRTWTFVVFILFGGLSLIGHLAFNGVGGPFEHWNVENWTRMFSFSCPTSHLFWAPQHALVGWLATAIVIHEDATDGGLLTGPWLIGFALLWSPFVALGLVPLFAVSAFRALRARGPTWRQAIPWLLWIPPVLIGLLLVSFFSAIRQSIPNEWAPAAFGAMKFVRVYFLFCVLEFGLWAMLVSQRPPLLRVAIGVLLALPFYKYGYFGDLMLRASIPSLFVLAVAVASELGQRVRLRLLVPWIIATTGAIASCYISVKHGPPMFTLAIPEHPYAIEKLRPTAVAVQYLGRPEAFFFTTLAR